MTQIDQRTLPAIAESSHTDKEYLLAEYGRLCSEIELRVGLGLQFFDRLLAVAERCAGLAGMFLTLAGLVISVGSHVIAASLVTLLLALLCYAASLVLLCCPILLAFLGSLCGENDLRMGQINAHIKYEHEPMHLPRGWETIRRKTFGSMPWFVIGKKQRSQYHSLASRQGVKLLSMRGLFVTVQCLFLLMAAVVAAPGVIYLPNPFLLAVLGLFFVIAGGLTVLTWFAIEHRRDRG